MSEHDLEKLLGGFAADTLTQPERETLFRAVLHDQELFNALADEQALKELLADPSVRRRLLQALASHRGPGRWRSWLDRLGSPAGLAWAGGVAVGVFAVALGLNVYQESLRQAADTAAVEAVRPTAPSTAPPPAPSVQAPAKDTEVKKSKAAPVPTPTTKDTRAGNMTSREQTAASRPQREPEPDETRTAPQQEASKKIDPPVAAFGKSNEQPARSLDEHRALPSAPAAGPESHNLAQAREEATAGASAQALFYGKGPAPDVGLLAQEKEAEPAQKAERFALRKALDKTAPLKPLALRYSLIAGERELNPNVAANQPGTATLTVESNQDSYVQIWRRAGDSLPELVLPAKETGRISLKTAAGQRQLLPVPPESDRLIVRLSRVPFGPITRQEAVMAGRGSAAQLTEAASGTEQATYVANPDLSAVELAIEIPIGTNAAR